MPMIGEKRDHQNFFFLSCIQISSLGLATLAAGNLVFTRYGSSVGFCSIVVGNLILWLLGITVVTMSPRVNFSQLIRSYVGNFTSLVISAIFIICVINWFAFGLNSTANSLHEFMGADSIFPSNIILRMGTSIGVFTALLALGGIRLLKWASIITFPFLMVYLVYQLLHSHVSIPPLTWSLSFSAILIVVFSFLGGVMNLPTFFRHSKSRSDSYLALTLYTLFYIFFECAAAWIGFKDASSGILLSNPANSWFQNQFVIVFILLTAVCNGLLNIYYSSAFFETFSPRFVGMKGHAIMGLMGTAGYAFVQISPPIALVLDLINGYITNLAVVLLVSFLFHLIVRTSSNRTKNRLNSIVWLISCISTTIAKFRYPETEFGFVLAGVNTVLLAFSSFIFFEETIRAMRDLSLRKVKKIDV